MSQLNPQSLVTWGKQNEILANKSIRKTIIQFVLRTFKWHIREDEEDVFLEGCMRCWFTCAFSVSILCLFLCYSELWWFYKTASTQTEQRMVELYVVFLCFPLCWIPRHSPKVVKAASQVLNSMWQYRDLRSLYKKVKPLYSGYINPESVQLHVKPLQGN